MPAAIRLAESPLQALLSERVAGRPLAWSRDLAIVGGLTSGLTSWGAQDLAPEGYAVVAAVVGVATGACLGLAMPRLIDLVRRRLHLVLIVALSPLLGTLWGGTTGAIAGVSFGYTNVVLGLIAGSLAGTVQVGFFWFPYTFQSVRRGRTWPLVAATVLSIPVVWAVSVAGTMFLMMGGASLAFGSVASM